MSTRDDLPPEVTSPQRPAPMDPALCVHCDHPRAGHGTRYAALPGHHEWQGPWTPPPPLRPAAPRPATAPAPWMEPATEPSGRALSWLRWMLGG